ncbi:mitochondrial dynamin GTPase Msp1 [Ophidiomyces ophidiicola]|uniref:Mitochondrial dynamin GTPase Msp1 n=1 Tax=Ophidiomyces ophidiicola TaxID=1387563 RepID=A0ACB8V0C3_9EURO|nr:mitochondrial dynamin GTPase Msp1 [Ophidiomyces ophidiicola]KAI1913428.1 mitochondrial dynamin GTPase Msp1 [Ophidiomyces ophidiicola]KAI1919645.1 mitochondrial dynamin GTPase Msp1 [Ophidiomyces ophidiicola]KAI1927151.1 mitochondrial dynamin GTPase Msp1 [Ophidiomyces ophidiicola]KAI1945406.1 mitochondrial dynamin GTPase Msp1 [Ophidiomyces ophidiicola]KAI1949873.1 mitochondrial dynamin GTPase Msp1 [Ophidiomyces ophidiicola]
MASGSVRRWQQIIQELILIAGTSLSTYFVVRFLLSRLELDPESQKREDAKRKSAAILRRLDREEDSDDSSSSRKRKAHKSKKETLELTQYEQAIAMDVVAPEDISVSFEDIGGLDDIIEELKESVIYPLTMPHLYRSSSTLLSAPSGVLLYGPPGCGKTMLAKALAHESGACFINLHISTLTEKWYGDSNKLVNAVFSLARKLEPSIVFIDEIDAVLGTRRSGEHEASGMVKAEFMTHWDGLTSANAAGQPQRLMVLGATNRIQDIDEAILRRMPKKFSVTLPAAAQRLRILGLVLKGTKVDRENFDTQLLVSAMAGMSGSDIKEACRDAAMIPVRELIRQNRNSIQSVNPDNVRGLRTDDFFRKAGGVKPSLTFSPTTKRALSKTQPEKEWSTESELEDDAVADKLPIAEGPD